MSNKEDNSIYYDYFTITKEYQQKYGKNTVLLMQVGSFFEIYGLKSPVTHDITDDSPLEEISYRCQLNTSEKKATYNDLQILMAGFPDYKLEKYIQKITENLFTAVVYTQEKNGKIVTRSLHSVNSPGTYVSYETDSSPQITNNIMCIWLDTYKPISKSVREHIIYGVSVANIFTGKTSMFEFKTPFLMNPTTFDELERTVSVASPSEVIIVSPFDTSTVNTIIQYSGIKTSIIHRVDSSDTTTNEKVKNCTKQTYIQHILSTFYGEETYQICSEFNTHAIATQSFCYLLNFIQEHNSNLVRQVGLPVFTNTSDRMVLANHTLKQLNMIDDDLGKKCGQLSSVLSLLNKCCTPLGKRRFQYQLLNPTFNEQWLRDEYNIIETFMQEKNICMLAPFRKILGQIRDIEKICRQIVIAKVYPSSIFHLFKSIENIQQLNMCLYESPEIYKYLCSEFDKQDVRYIENICSQCTDYIHRYLVITDCKNIHSVYTFETNIIKPGVSSHLDELIQRQRENMELFQGIREHLNQLIRNRTNDKDNSTVYVKEHETEKSGSSLQITKTRGKLLKTILTEYASSQHPYITVMDRSIHTNDIKLTNASSNYDEIEFPLLTRICNELLTSKDKINAEISKVFSSFVENFEKEWLSRLEHLAIYVSKLDVLQSKVYIAKEYNYCKPAIDSGAQKAYVDARDLRHVLIEHIQQNELYVPNDVVIGNETYGILLYGTNAVGKTSMIRALGIAVILAQAGMYVPCSKFTYKPYTAIFSRILGNDNIFKGLSTFAVEMSELRIILKMADENSLILGDEVCSGTENESALSIFVSALMHLHDNKSSFVFSTHFHEIVNYSEVNDMENIRLMHLSVHYDREHDCIVYDRKLKDGSGPRTYGLEVAAALHLPQEFLDRTHVLRNKYFPNTKGDLERGSSPYNAKKVKGKCEMCKKEIGEEVHHLQYQKDANEDGFIGHFHKNHPANLLTVCEKCHTKIHKEDKPTTDTDTDAPKKKVVKKKTTKGYIIEG